MNLIGWWEFFCWCCGLHTCRASFFFCFAKFGFGTARHEGQWQTKSVLNLLKVWNRLELLFNTVETLIYRRKNIQFTHMQTLISSKAKNRMCFQIILEDLTIFLHYFTIKIYIPQPLI